MLMLTAIIRLVATVFSSIMGVMPIILIHMTIIFRFCSLVQQQNIGAEQKFEEKITK